MVTFTRITFIKINNMDAIPGLFVSICRLVTNLGCTYAILVQFVSICRLVTNLCCIILLNLTWSCCTYAILVQYVSIWRLVTNLCFTILLIWTWMCFTYAKLVQVITNLFFTILSWSFPTNLFFMILWNLNWFLHICSAKSCGSILESSTQTCSSQSCVSQLDSSQQTCSSQLCGSWLDRSWQQIKIGTLARATHWHDNPIIVEDIHSF